MIRFACPGCAATFTVDDSKAGKVGKCPKCQSQFQIPKQDASAAAASPPPPPAYAPPPDLPPVPPPPPAPRIAPVAPASSSVEIAPCPKCSARLTVGISDLGAEVECPYCKTVYKAARGDALVPVPVPAPADDFASLGDGDDEPPPSKRRGGKASKRGRRDDDEEDDRPSKRKHENDDDEEDDDDRPSRRSKSRKKSRRSGGSNQESKRVMAGILAILVGWLGVHKFFLGYTTAGVIMLLLACTGVTGFIALAEGIIYLTKTDDEFIEMYQENAKEWF